MPANIFVGFFFYPMNYRNQICSLRMSYSKTNANFAKWKAPHAQLMPIVSTCIFLAYAYDYELSVHYVFAALWMAAVEYRTYGVHMLMTMAAFLQDAN